ncbi:MAG TPA: aldehyde dehydrogenase family protein [Candidatus Polarisedimenticolaceae bacterium]|nr:aldehyde dehydrogenase family protein [Candidatus Polarisedimenticolaceae bacterium]
MGASPPASKVTYVTLAGNDEANAAYDAAVQRVRRTLGATHPFFIDGSARGEGRAAFDDLSPGDASLVVGRFASATAEDVGDAITGARRAFLDWGSRPWPERVAILRAAAETISARRSELAALMSLEVGKNRLEAMGDAEEAADLFRYYAAQMEEANGFEKPLDRLLPGEDTRSVLRPHGVFAVVAPFNFPLALAAGMAGGALVAGNTVVFKPSSDAPLTGLRLYEILTGAGVPAGAFQFITGKGGALGEAFQGDRFDGIVFTGSKEVGLDLHRRFSKRWPKPVIVEMGGKNPAIVTRRADLQKAAEGIARSAFGYGGQKCSACSRAFVAREVHGEFLERLVEVAKTLAVGDPTHRGTYMGPVITAKAKATHAAAVAEARRDGHLVFEGKIPQDPALARGHFVAPVVAERLHGSHRLWRDELFVPFLAVDSFGTLDEAIMRANDTEYGLTAGVFSEDEDEVKTFFDRIEAGVVYANRRTGATTGAWPGVQSFCGWKASGSTGKGGCGPWYVQQFLREQSRTIVR